MPLFRHIGFALVGVLLGASLFTTSAEALPEQCAGADPQHFVGNHERSHYRRSLSYIESLNESELNAVYARRDELSLNVFQETSLVGRLRFFHKKASANYRINCLRNSSTDLDCQMSLEPLRAGLFSELTSYRAMLAVSQGHAGLELLSAGFSSVNWVVARHIRQPKEARARGTRIYMDPLNDEEAQLVKSLFIENVLRPLGYLEVGLDGLQQFLNSFDRGQMRQYGERISALQDLAKDRYVSAMTRFPLLGFYKSHQSNDSQALVEALSIHKRIAERQMGQRLRLRNLVNYPTALLADILVSRANSEDDCQNLAALFRSEERRLRNNGYLRLTGTIVGCGLAFVTGAWPVCAALTVLNSSASIRQSASRVRSSVYWQYLDPENQDEIDLVDAIRSAKGDLYLEMALSVPITLGLGAAAKVATTRFMTSRFSAPVRRLFVRENKKAPRSVLAQALVADLPITRKPMRYLFGVTPTQSFWPASIFSVGVNIGFTYPEVFKTADRFMRVRPALLDPDHEYYPYYEEMRQRPVAEAMPFVKETLPMIAMIHHDPAHSDLKAEILNDHLSLVNIRARFQEREEFLTEIANEPRTQSLYFVLYREGNMARVRELKALAQQAYRDFYMVVAPALFAAIGDSFTEEEIEVDSGSTDSSVLKQVRFSAETFELAAFLENAEAFRQAISNQPEVLYNFGMEPEIWLSLTETEQTKLAMVCARYMALNIFHKQVFEVKVHEYLLGAHFELAQLALVQAYSDFASTLLPNRQSRDELRGFTGTVLEIFSNDYTAQSYAIDEDTRVQELPPTPQLMGMLNDFFFDQMIFEVNELSETSEPLTVYKAWSSEGELLDRDQLDLFSIKRNLDPTSRRFFLPNGDVIGFMESLRRMIRYEIGI